MGRDQPPVCWIDAFSNDAIAMSWQTDDISVCFSGRCFACDLIGDSSALRLRHAGLGGPELTDFQGEYRVPRIPAKVVVENRFRCYSCPRTLLQSGAEGGPVEFCKRHDTLFLHNPWNSAFCMLAAAALQSRIHYSSPSEWSEP